MPRVSQQHEQEVRDRIVRAALAVFAERGFHRATMQDIVRASGLSVGAIYTYFKSKSDLILAGCDLITDQELAQLGDRLASVTGYRDRIAAAIGYWFDNLAVEQIGPRLGVPAPPGVGRGRHGPGDPRDAAAPPAGDRDGGRPDPPGGRDARRAAGRGWTSRRSAMRSRRCSTGC